MNHFWHFSHGSGAAEDPVSAESCRKAGELEEAAGAQLKGAEEGCRCSPGLQLCSVQGIFKYRDYINYLYIIIIICFQSQMPDPKTYKQHFENKHPKNPLPDDIKDVAV